MAQKVQTFFIDDLDGNEAKGSLRPGLDGADYEIDLNAKHARQLRAALATVRRAARRAGGSTRRPGRAPPQTPSSGVSTSEVRERAKPQGLEVKDRGQMPAELVVKFKAATGQ